MCILADADRLFSGSSSSLGANWSADENQTQAFQHWSAGIRTSEILPCRVWKSEIQWRPPDDPEDICLYSDWFSLWLWPSGWGWGLMFFCLQASLQSVCLVVTPSFRTPTAAPPSAPAGCSSRPCRISSATTPSPRAGTSSRSSTSQPACPPSVWRWEEWWFVTDRMIHFKALVWHVQSHHSHTSASSKHSLLCEMDFASVP